MTRATRTMDMWEYNMHEKTFNAVHECAVICAVAAAVILVTGWSINETVKQAVKHVEIDTLGAHFDACSSTTWMRAWQASASLLTSNTMIAVHYCSVIWGPVWAYKTWASCFKWDLLLIVLPGVNVWTRPSIADGCTSLHEHVSWFWPRAPIWRYTLARLV